MKIMRRVRWLSQTLITAMIVAGSPVATCPVTQGLSPPTGAPA